MSTRRQVNFQGKLVDAEVIEFEADREQWSTYLLHDGTSLKIKPVMTEVLRLNDVFAPNGDPVYMVQAQQIVHITPSDSVRKR
jgi:hypothetical protein